MVLLGSVTSFDIKLMSMWSSSCKIIFFDNFDSSWKRTIFYTCCTTQTSIHVLQQALGLGYKSH